jgi:hypothetical protein
MAFHHDRSLAIPYETASEKPTRKMGRFFLWAKQQKCDYLALKQQKCTISAGMFLAQVGIVMRNQIDKLIIYILLMGLARKL